MTRLTTDCVVWFLIWLDASIEKSMVIYDTECRYWDWNKLELQLRYYVFSSD